MINGHQYRSRPPSWQMPHKQKHAHTTGRTDVLCRARRARWSGGLGGILRESGDRSGPLVGPVVDLVLLGEVSRLSLDVEALPAAVLDADVGDVDDDLQRLPHGEHHRAGLVAGPVEQGQHEVVLAWSVRDIAEGRAFDRGHAHSLRERLHD